jgi:LysR family transcriptional regulator, carnitine catabolism transcriptional activator
MNLTYRQFEILIAAAESESFSAAAHRLGISQPSLSESIRRIEREIGARLFERTTRSLKLTDQGRSAAAVAREAVRDFKRALERLASSTSERQGRITIAALPSIACAALPAALVAFKREHPAVEIVVHDVQHERALLLVTEGVADLAVTIKPAQQGDLVFDEIASDVAHLVCRSDHPLARRKQVRWRDLSGLAFIGITRISSVRRLTDAAFVHAEIAIEPRYEVEQIPSAVALVEAGLGVTALPSLTFSMFKGRNLAVRPLLEPRLRRNVGFVTVAGRTLPKHCDALIRAVRQGLLHELRAQKLRA